MMRAAPSRPLRDAALALALLTIVPTTARWPDEERPAVAGWFPLAGAFVGACGWALVLSLRLVGWRTRAAFVVAAVVVALWALVTRMLHWDGLADYADGLWGGSTTDQRLDIMSDSHTGAFGATAIALVVLVEVGAVTSIVLGGHQLPLLVCPALARFAATCAAWFGSPARSEGLGRSVMGRPRAIEALAALLVLGGAGVLLWFGFGVWGIGLGAAGVVAGLVVPHLLSGAVGGVTGDVMGASVVLCEALLLGLAAMMWGA